MNYLGEELKTISIVNREEFLFVGMVKHFLKWNYEKIRNDLDMIHDEISKGNQTHYRITKAKTSGLLGGVKEMAVEKIRRNNEDRVKFIKKRRSSIEEYERDFNYAHKIFMQVKNLDRLSNFDREHNQYLFPDGVERLKNKHKEYLSRHLRNEFPLDFLEEEQFLDQYKKW